MERYNEYKDSGVQWLGEIPSHWTIMPLKYSGRFCKGKLPSNTNDNCLGKPIIGASEMNGNMPSVYSEDNSVPQCTQNDILFLWDGANAGLVSSFHDGIVASTVTKFTCDNSNIVSTYLYYLEKNYQRYYKERVGGTTIPHMNSQYIASCPLLIPSIQEQQAIADYLDTATTKIDEAIAQQQKMIDLLNERKQIIINNAVTKGLNPDAPMKDSGVEWSGEIPEHWEVMKLKHVTSKIGSGSTPRGGAEVYQDSGIMFLRSQNVYNDGLKLDDVAHIVDGVHQKMKRTQVKYNDILYNITGGSIGRCCCYDREDEANVNQHVSIVRPKGIIAKYLMYNLQSDNAQRQLRETLKGGNREGLAAVTFKEFLILTCPKEEQNQIVSHIERMFVNIDRAISNATKQISLLQERKQIIINDVVTGKVKVC